MHTYSLVELNTCTRAFLLLQHSWLDIFVIHMPSSLTMEQNHALICSWNYSCLNNKVTIIST